LAAKLVVTADKGGSRIALVGASGKELLTSVVFSEPRAKGATLRSLKGLLGDDIVVEDQTLSSPRTGRAKASSDANGNGAVAEPAAKTAATKTAAKKTAKRATRPATKPTAKPAEAAATTAAEATESPATAVESVVKKAKRSVRSAAKSVKTAAKG
jgi:hypothetical protein